MPAFEMPFVTPSILPSRRNLGQILQETWQHYGQNGWALTRPLLAPILKTTLGVYACLVLNYLFINEWGASLLALGYFGWIITGILLITTATLWPAVNGFGEYLILSVSLNRNAAETFCKQPIQIKPAYDLVLKENSNAYQMLLLVYLLIPAGVMLVLGVLSVGVLLMLQQNILTISSLIGLVLVQILGGVMNLIIALFLTFIFQIIAFEKASLNPWPVLVKSVQMVWRRLPAAVGLQIILALVTLVIVPGVAVILGRVLWISAPLDQLHLWLIGLITQGASPTPENVSIVPAYGQFFQNVQSNTMMVANGLTDTVLSWIITALLLPLGTLAFTRLAWDIYFFERQS